MGPTDLDDALRADVRRGLTSNPKELPPKWFYDDRGCELFDAITRLPEYYPTERERSILGPRPTTIAERLGRRHARRARLGHLGQDPRAARRAGRDRAAPAVRPVRDQRVDPARAAAAAVGVEYPGIEVQAVVGDFERHLAELPQVGRRLIAFLGGTIGNLAPAERKRFLADLADNMAPGDRFLLGTDLVKDVDRLEAAYDDAAGGHRRVQPATCSRWSTASSAPTSIRRGFAHVARFDLDEEWIEMRLRSLDDQTCTSRASHLSVDFAEGEEMRTEISAKFRRAGLEAELAAAGLRLERWMTDPDGDFALSLSTRA